MENRIKTVTTNYHDIIMFTNASEKLFKLSLVGRFGGDWQTVEINKQHVLQLIKIRDELNKAINELNH